MEEPAAAEKARQRGRGLMGTLANGLLHTMEQLRKSWPRSLALLAACALCAILVSVTAAVLLAVFLAMLLLGLDNRVSILASIACLAAVAVLLALKEGIWAGKVAVWAFFLLAAGIAAQVFEWARSCWTARSHAARTAAVERDREGRGLITGIKSIDKAVLYLRGNLFSAIGFMVVATFIGNFVNYLFNVTSGRLLGREAYGEFAALLSIFMILTVPTNSLQALIAKMVAQFRLEENRAGIREMSIKCLQVCLIAAAAAVALFLALGRPLASFLHIEGALPVVVCGIAVAFTLLAPVFNGLLQGFQLFAWLGSLFLAYALGRLVFGWIFIKVGWGVSGALLGGAASSLLVVVAAALVMREVYSYERIPAGISLRRLGREYLPFIISNGIMLLLVSIDLVIVKRKFASSVAGDYASASFIGKIILYFPSSVGIVIFPKLVEAHVSGNGTRSLLNKGIAIVLAGSLFLSGLFIAFPRLTIGLLYGSEFLGATSVLWIICLAMSAYTVAHILIYYFLATEDSRFLVITLAVLAVLGITAMYLFAATSFQVALMQFVVSVMFIAASFARLKRRVSG